MIPANEHRCPVCSVTVIPIWRAICKDCFADIPWEMRAAFMHAYRMRVVRNREYQEELIGVRLWYVAYKKRVEEWKEH